MTHTRSGEAFISGRVVVSNDREHPVSNVDDKWMAKSQAHVERPNRPQRHDRDGCSGRGYGFVD